MLYSMDLIKENQWHFISERKIISEDVYSLLDLFSGVKSVSVIKDYLDFYCINNSSLTKSYGPDRYQKVKEFYLSSIQLCEKKNYSKTYWSIPFIYNSNVKAGVNPKTYRERTNTGNHQR